MILLQPTLIVRIYKQFISFRNSFKSPLQRTIGGVSFEHFEQQIAKLFESAKTCCYQEFWPSPRFVTFHKSQNKRACSSNLTRIKLFICTYSSHSSIIANRTTKCTYRNVLVKNFFYWQTLDCRNLIIC